MGLKYDLNNVLEDVRIKMIEIYGENLNKIILFGSYARGDYSDESDIDVMLLVKCGEDEIKKIRKDFISIGSDLCLNYDIEISIMVFNEDYFNYWKDVMPLFKNVVKEGVDIYGQPLYRNMQGQNEKV